MDKQIKDVNEAMEALQSIFCGMVEPDPCPHGWSFRGHCPNCQKTDAERALIINTRKLKAIRRQLDQVFKDAPKIDNPPNDCSPDEQ